MITNGWRKFFGGDMKDLFGQKIVLYAGIALIIVGFAGLVGGSEPTSDMPEQTVAANSSQASVTRVTSNEDGTVVTYQGVEGQDAISLLKAGAEVVTEDSTLGEYVVAINGVSQTDTEYWLFYVDGQAVPERAADYVSRGGETIEWRLEN